MEWIDAVKNPPKGNENKDYLVWQNGKAYIAQYTNVITEYVYTDRIELQPKTLDEYIWLGGSGKYNPSHYADITPPINNSNNDLNWLLDPFS